MTRISAALVGNPNAGKTSVFNLLTNQDQRVANWPGITVEKKTGTFSAGKNQYELIDLPGCYAINNSEQLDEKLTADFLIENEPDLLINVINVCQLPLHLYLSIQLLETNIPMLIVLNFMDQLSDQDAIKIGELKKITKCEVITISARNPNSLEQLKLALSKPLRKRTFKSHKAINDSIQAIKKSLPQKFKKNWLATNLIENNITISSLPETAKQTVKAQQKIIAAAFDDEPEIIVADIRYNLLQKIINVSQTKSIASKANASTNNIDKLLLHPVFGLPIFLIIMYAMFAACLNFGSSIQEPFAASCELWLVKLPISLLNAKIALPSWLIALLFNGLGTAITTTLSFIPPLFLLFSALSILEQSGYMARAAFITDKIMATINLPGRAFVSLLIGFGCNVPAIMSTRTLQNHEDRILTAMMTPFMSCTARLALYVVLVQAFFKNSGSLVIFSIYLIGISAGILTGLIIKRMLMTNDSPPLILELPDYILPSIKYTIKDTCKRIKRFIQRTFKFMVIACSCLAILNTIPGPNSESLLANIAQKINFILQPMGIAHNSWPTTVALIMGTVAKEVMVGVFHTLGSINPGKIIMPFDHVILYSKQIWQQWLLSSNDPTLNSTINNIKLLFHSKNSVIAFLIFSCLYLPCFSTISALKKECGNKWGNIASIWSLILAYGAATLYYQWATFAEHELQTMTISIMIFAAATAFLKYIKRFGG